MKNQYLLFISTLLFIIFSSFSNDKVVNDFCLRNIDGKMVSSKAYKNAKGLIVVFTCNHCPFAKLYTKRLNDLNTKFSKLHVPLIAINSMDTLIYEDETFELMQKRSKQEKYNFPYLQDGSQTVGKQFKAEYTPTAFVIWKINNKWVIKYKGAIDDNGEKPKIAISYISKMVNELLLNKNVSTTVTASFGCKIFYR